MQHDVNASHRPHYLKKKNPCLLSTASNGHPSSWQNQQESDVAHTTGGMVSTGWRGQQGREGRGVLVQK